MKKQALNPYLPSWEYVPDGEPYYYFLPREQEDPENDE